MKREARKTVALRGAAAVFTPPSNAASNPCLNCGTNVQLNYCPECGQRAIDPDPTLREFAQELAQELLNWDGKLIATFRLLFTRPGELTQEYLLGRRTRYISPLRTYLTCSVLFFFVSAVTPSASEIRARKGAGRDSSLVTRMGPLTVESSDRAEIQRYLDSTSRSKDRVTRVMGTHFANAIRHNGEFTDALAEAIPRMMFVLVPIFAWLLSLVFRQQRMRYPQHLAFALHVHAFMFVALLPTAAAGLIHSQAIRFVLELSGMGAVAWYLGRAVRRVYSTTRSGAIARSALLSASYLVAFSVATGITFVLILLLRY
jgi:hypothetical protein